MKRRTNPNRHRLELVAYQKPPKDLAKNLANARKVASRYYHPHRTTRGK